MTTDDLIHQSPALGGQGNLESAAIAWVRLAAYQPTRLEPVQPVRHRAGRDQDGLRKPRRRKAIWITCAAKSEQDVRLADL
jgi:hypothetical protein